MAFMLEPNSSQVPQDITAFIARLESGKLLTTGTTQEEVNQSALGIIEMLTQTLEYRRYLSVKPLRFSCSLFHPKLEDQDLKKIYQLFLKLVLGQQLSLLNRMSIDSQVDALFESLYGSISPSESYLGRGLMMLQDVKHIHLKSPNGPSIIQHILSLCEGMSIPDDPRRDYSTQGYHQGVFEPLEYLLDGEGEWNGKTAQADILSLSAPLAAQFTTAAMRKAIIREVRTLHRDYPEIRDEVVRRVEIKIEDPHHSSVSEREIAEIFCKTREEVYGEREEGLILTQQAINRVPIN